MATPNDGLWHPYLVHALPIGQSGAQINLRREIKAMQQPSSEIWINAEGTRYFILDDSLLADGELLIVNRSGGRRSVSPHALASFEVTESQAREWAKEQLGEALGEIRASIDGKLSEWRERLGEFNRTPITEDTTLTPNAAPALLSLFKQLPGIIADSLSGEGQRLGESRDAMTGLQQKLKASGIDLDDRFTNFPDRLAGLRKQPDQEGETPSTSGGPLPDKG